MYSHSTVLVTSTVNKIDSSFNSFTTDENSLAWKYGT